MTYLILIFILIIVILFLIFFRERIKKTIIYRSSKQKKIEERKKKIIGLLRKKDRITNNEVQKSLGVSDATATRYLDDLEKEGKIKQVGQKGRFVYYKLI